MSEAKKVLIIEDAFDVLFALKALIQLRGFKVLTASSGLEGATIAAEENPDLILIDLQLPDINGDEVVRRLRDTPPVAQAPMVCITSYGGGMEHELLDAGFDEVISKSGFMTSFDDTLEKYLAA